MKLNETTTVTENKTIQLVQPNRLIPHPKVPNRALDTAWVEELSKSIESSGMDTPVSAWDGGQNQKVEVDGKQYPATFLVAGHHRLAAIKSLKRRNPTRYTELFSAGVPTLVRSGSVTDAIFAQLRENVARKDMPADQVLPVMQNLRDIHKMEGKDIAKHIGKSPSWVSTIFQIEANLGEEGMEAVATGGVTISQAQKVAKSLKEKRAKGEAVDAKKAVAEVKAKSASRKSSGGQRAVKRDSLSTIYKRYKALPKMTFTKALTLLEAGVEYALQIVDELPPELEAADAPVEKLVSKKKK